MSFESPQHAIDVALVQALIPPVTRALHAKRLDGVDPRIQMAWLRALKGQARYLAGDRLRTLSAKARASAERSVIRIFGVEFLDDLKVRHTKEMPVMKSPKFPPGDPRNHA